MKRNPGTLWTVLEFIRFEAGMNLADLVNVVENGLCDFICNVFGKLCIGGNNTSCGGCDDILIGIFCLGIGSRFNGFCDDTEL